MVLRQEVLRVNKKYLKEMGMNLSEKDIIETDLLSTLDEENKKSLYGSCHMGRNRIAFFDNLLRPVVPLTGAHIEILRIYVTIPIGGAKWIFKFSRMKKIYRC